MRLIGLALLFTGWLLAQPIGFGLKIGAPLNDAFNLATGSGSLSQSYTHFTIGPMVELRLPFGFGVEADLLYKRLSSDYSIQGFSASASANSWETPILAKYRFGFPLVKPYVGAGPSFRWLTNANMSVNCGPVCAQFQPVENSAGFAMEGGVEIKLLLIRIAPELRYTRWGSRAFELTSGGSTIFHSSENQAEFLVGITF